jgi:hypothetical protein
MARRSRSVLSRRDSPPSRMHPDSMRAPLGNIPSAANAVSVFPLPDSPITPAISPGPIERLTLSTTRAASRRRSTNCESRRSGQHPCLRAARLVDRRCRFHEVRCIPSQRVVSRVCTHAEHLGLSSERLPTTWACSTRGRLWYKFRPKLRRSAIGRSNGSVARKPRLLPLGGRHAGGRFERTAVWHGCCLDRLVRNRLQAVRR